MAKEKNPVFDHFLPVARQKCKFRPKKLQRPQSARVIASVYLSYFGGAEEDAEGSKKQLVLRSFLLLFAMRSGLHNK